MYNEKYTEYDKLVYEKELKNFLPDEFIDFHTHVQSKDLDRYGSHNGGSSWTDNIAKDGSEVELLLDIHFCIVSTKQESIRQNDGTSTILL